MPGNHQLEVQVVARGATGVPLIAKALPCKDIRPIRDGKAVEMSVKNRLVSGVEFPIGSKTAAAPGRERTCDLGPLLLVKCPI